jgi:hypothetical protein
MHGHGCTLGKPNFQSWESNPKHVYVFYISTPVEHRCRAQKSALNLCGVSNDGMLGCGKLQLQLWKQLPSFRERLIV